MAGRQQGLVRMETRSRSVESEQRSDTGTRARYVPVLKRERSLQDIDKDISVIWKELQSLDTGTSPDPSSPPPLSEQPLVTPSWRKPSPAATTGGPRAWIPRPHTRPGSITPSYVSPSPRQARAAFFGQPVPENEKTQEAGKPTIGPSARILETDFPTSNKPSASQPDAQSATKLGQPASHSTNQTARSGQPGYMATRHTDSSQSSHTSSTQTSMQTEKANTTCGAYNTSSLPSRLPSGQKRSQSQAYSVNPSSSIQQSSSHKSLHNSSHTSSSSYSTSTRTDTECVPQPAPAREPLKSCLKSESRRSSATRSETSEMRESPGRHGTVNFVSQRGSILTGEPRKDRSPGRNQGETDTQGDRVVPIVVMGGKDRSHSREKETNPFLEEGGTETEVESKGSMPTKDVTIAGGKNGLKSIEGDRTENACYACDVCTQTEISGKKNCIVM